MLRSIVERAGVAGAMAGVVLALGLWLSFGPGVAQAHASAGAAADGQAVTQLTAQADKSTLRKQAGAYTCDLLYTTVRISDNYVVIEGAVSYMRYKAGGGVAPPKGLNGTYKFKLGRKCKYYIFGEFLGKKAKRTAYSHDRDFDFYYFKKAAFCKLLRKGALSCLSVVVKKGQATVVCSDSSFFD